MSEEAEKEYKRAKLRGMLSSFGAASALSLAFGLTLTFTVIYFAQDPPAEFLAYVPPAEDAPPRNQPTTPQLSTKTATPSNTVAPSVIVTTGAAPVAMAQIDIPMEDSQDDGLSLDIGIGMDNGLGEIGEGGAGMGSSQASGSAIEGVLYDLKMTKNKAFTRIYSTAAKGADDVWADRHEFFLAASAFLRSWNMATLSRYYKSPAKLYASSFFVPAARAGLAPFAFQCPKEVKPSGLLVVYRGKVKSPVSGKIRFVGVGDDALYVRFGGKVRLECGYEQPTLYDKKKIETARAFNLRENKYFDAYKARIKKGEVKGRDKYQFIPYDGLRKWNDELGGLTAGDIFEVKEGTTYPIDIAIPESGGGFGYVLMWEHVSDKPVTQNGKMVKGKRFYLFRTNFTEPNRDELMKLLGNYKEPTFDWPEYDPDSPIWVAVP